MVLTYTTNQIWNRYLQSIGPFKNGHWLPIHTGTQALLAPSLDRQTSVARIAPKQRVEWGWGLWLVGGDWNIGLVWGNDG